MAFRSLPAVAMLVCTLAGSLVAQPITVQDGAGLPVTVAVPARRVASVLSSAVDIIGALGAYDRIAARTRYDTAAAVRSAMNVGGGIDPDIDSLVASRPDLFVAWSGQAASAAVSRMRALGVPIYLVATTDTTALFATVHDLGALMGIAPRADSAALGLRRELHAVRSTHAAGRGLSAVYVISRNPLIIAAASSFVGQLIGVAGADNPFHDLRGQFPTLTLDAFAARDPDVLIVGRRDDGGRQLDVLRATPGWRDLRAVRAGAVIEVDGEQWGRPTLRAGVLVRELARQLRRINAAPR